MKKYLNISFLLLLFVLLSTTTTLLANDESKLPQFDTNYYSQQLFWLAINFGILFLFLKYFVIKKVSKIKTSRSSMILSNIEKSIKIKKDIDKINSDITSIKDTYRSKIATARDILLKKISDLSKNKQEEIDQYKSEKLAKFELKKSDDTKNIDFENDIKEISDSIIEKLNLNK